ncbi:MAG: hypothetical protein IIY29_02050 [Firmicutes bacterium]|nr:hypothetical protein [Bacillota bacterium]
MRFDDTVLHELKKQERLHGRAEKVLQQSVPDVLFSKTRPDGRMQFYIKDPASGRQRYVNLEHLDDIRRILDQKYAGALLDATERNIKALKYLKENYFFISPESVFDTLPKAYQEAREYLAHHGKKDSLQTFSGGNQGFSPSEKPGREEGLIHRTSFGLMVRSKAEALIAEILYAEGFWVYYEKKLTLVTEFGTEVDVYPDFSIDLGGGRWIYWEHKGMFGDPQYAENDMKKMRWYHMNGIYEPLNLIVTCDGPNGESDMEAIRRIITGVILPQVQGGQPS